MSFVMYNLLTKAVFKLQCNSILYVILAAQLVRDCLQGKMNSIDYLSDILHF